MLQAPTDVVMIRPHNFHPNPETAKDNAFQTAATGDIAAQARQEHDAAVTALRAAGITTHVFDDLGTDTPDSVFPNNWFSTHSGGRVAVYPMYAQNRRRERRWDVIDTLKTRYRVQDVIDYSGLEHDGLALEGTGAMVLDHIAHVAYVARSNRADPLLLERFCTHFGFEPIAFDACDATGTAIYHTNVLMCIGTRFALIGAEMIRDNARRHEVIARLAETGRDVIQLSAEQIGAFAGNAIELTGPEGSRLALSTTAMAALTPHQQNTLARHTTCLPLDIPTIETAGGSVRCMIAGLHLARRQGVTP